MVRIIVRSCRSKDGLFFLNCSLNSTVHIWRVRSIREYIHKDENRISKKFFLDFKADKKDSRKFDLYFISYVQEKERTKETVKEKSNLVFLLWAYVIRSGTPRFLSVHRAAIHCHEIISVFLENTFTSPCLSEVWQLALEACRCWAVVDGLFLEKLKLARDVIFF